MYANIQRWGNSSALRLPKAILESAFLKENDRVEVIASEEQIIIKKAKTIKHKTLAERLKNFNGEYEAEEWNTGKIVGKEIW
ncbi:AbrB/MazE/SpoVT family DNA-binding domain-containing protein [Clostridium taeniosporum]|uniref:AbrB/MazE/SpoVT family DNA-binding domain-containing protein n=1 Tax=Clostridium taeniosporum TaxID=394958 RepID=A0A1D7XMM0_9CLOT|nr:AbrB/MazE/SpoVT family DNA-binding domain-containing protein [Clostridium taeniosporum]AOR24595.1 AbrB/MazE/SpoVT family DNA-binding domain-containing protein [Clostridium taeniosporum]